MKSLVQDDSSLEDALGVESNANSSTSNRHWIKTKIVIARILLAISAILFVLLVVKTHINIAGTVSNIDDGRPQLQPLDNKKLQYLDNNLLARAQEILQIAEIAAMANYSFVLWRSQKRRADVIAGHVFDKLKPWPKRAKEPYFFHMIVILFQAYKKQQ